MFSGRIQFLYHHQVYLARETSFFLDPLPGLSLLLFGLEPQKLFLLPPFLIIAIENIFDLSAISIENSVRDQYPQGQRLSPQGRTHPIAPTALTLDLMHPPLFAVDLTSHFALGLSVPSRSVLSVIIDDVIQSILELVETGKY